MKIVVAVTGASGAIYAKVLLDKLKKLSEADVEINLVWSEQAPNIWEYELGNKDYEQLPFKTFSKNDFMAPFASGSSSFEAMIICPCSMGTLGRIAAGMSNDLITRAADVMLKERRKLVCVVRETPYSLIHLRNMTSITEAGGIICPATPSFYSKPNNFEDLAATVVDRALQLVGINTNSYRWQE
jgi:4-hydroxy-3-polyprenylbenzoate decarboxylase